MPELHDLALPEIEQAFEVYYELGVNRTTVQTAEQLGIPVEQVDEWHELYNWDTHIQERVEFLGRAFAEQFHTETLQLRSRLLVMIQNTLSNFNDTNMGVPLDITGVADFQRLAKAYETLVRANALAAAMGKDKDSGKTAKSWADLLGSIDDA